MKELWTRFIKDESGQGLTEYVLIIALVAVGLILVLYAFREAIANVFRDATDELNSASVNQAQP